MEIKNLMTEKEINDYIEEMMKKSSDINAKKNEYLNEQIIKLQKKYDFLKELYEKIIDKFCVDNKEKYKIY